MEKSMETVNSQDTCRNQVKWTFSWEHNERIFADGILSECEHILKKSDITGTKHEDFWESESLINESWEAFVAELKCEMAAACVGEEAF